MALFAVERFERDAEAFLRARSQRTLHHLAGRRLDLGLAALYGDFPEYTSAELYADLLDAQLEDDRKARLRSFLLAAELEGRTLELVERVATLEASASVVVGDQTIAWRSAPSRWITQPVVSQRHALQEAWRAEIRTSFNPVLARWQEALAAALVPLGEPSLEAAYRVGMGAIEELATRVLENGAELYRHVLGVYFGQLELPLDEAWTADAAFAFRAPRFDPSFPANALMPTLVRTFRALGIEIEDEITAGNLMLDLEPRPAKATGLRCIATDIPRETHVIYRLVGGWQDYAALLRGCGAAQHTYHTDPTLPFTARWLGDPTPTMAYGLLFEGLVLEPAWLQTFPDMANVADLLVIAHLARQQRVRAAAAMVEVQRQLWASEPSSSIAVEYEERLTSATGVRYFGDEYLRATSRAPWEAGEAAVLVRASVLAAQLRQYLRHEFDEEWFRNPRAGRFLVRELWRTGRRHSAEALLSFMGYEGFDTTILWDESAEVLRTV